jgi:hypothetical protein
MTQTCAWSYDDLLNHKKFNAFQFIKFKDFVEKGQNIPIHSIEEDTEEVDELAEEERHLLEQLKANRTKKARRKALGQIEQLRSARGLVIANQIHVFQKKIQDLLEERDRLEKEAAEVERGERDNELIAKIVEKACEIHITTKIDPSPRGRKE